jgi:hypothetical protein
MLSLTISIRMVIRLVFILFAVLVYNQARSQNIVPNPDWESGPNISTNYPDGWAINGPDLWLVTNVSPDRIFKGDTTLYRDCHLPQSGNAYVMFYGPYNESGKCTLDTPIISGNTYLLTYWLDVDDNFYGGSGAIEFNFIGGNSLCSPYIINTGDWQYFDTTFTASENATELELIGTGNNLTKIDNIHLTRNETTETEGNYDVNTIIYIYPNPSQGEIHITGEFIIDEINIIDLLGQIIYENKPNERKVILQFNKEGIYFITVVANGQTAIKKILITH